eukprot:TRINITY_DN1451_c1_g1_i6.p1 TRINITY_DN1451_c1_g1~~TRINITY_DN1451_c1_g1_i6.p1  ORF type:complete len:930 (-),score=162.17 TRINITY_DN1451_c1_g1_i6:271-3060(-)
MIGMSLSSFLIQTSTLRSIFISANENAGGLVGQDISNLTSKIIQTNITSTSDVNNLIISSTGAAGGFIGYTSEQTTIIDSFLKGVNVTSSTSNAGGFIGTVTGANIQIYGGGLETSSVIGINYISAFDHSGGLIGYTNSNVNVSNTDVYNINIKGDKATGGFLGFVSGSEARISQSSLASKADSVINQITNNDFGGGLVGQCDTVVITNSLVQNVYLSQQANDVGFFVGNTNISIIIDCTLNTKTPSVFNQLTGNSTASTCGGFVGYSLISTISGTISNLKLNHTCNSLGGIIGSGSISTILFLTMNSITNKNLISSPTSATIGLFGNGFSQITANNVLIENLDVISTVSDNLGVLVSFCPKIIVNNFTITNNLNGLNFVTGGSTTTGGICGGCTNVNITNAAIKNTFISSPTSTSVGGFLGSGSDVFISYSYLDTYNSSVSLIEGQSIVSGMVGSVGFNGKLTIVASGIYNGKITSTLGTASGITQKSNSVSLDRVFLKNNVTIYGATQSAGFLLTTNATATIFNSYTRATLNSSLNPCTGLVGANNNPLKLTSANSYSACNFLEGCSVIAQTVNNVSTTDFNISNVFYDNSFPDGGYGFSGYNSSYLLTRIYNSSFDQCWVWRYDHLLIEISSNTSNLCTLATTDPPTFSPSTITPSLITPSTITPSTFFPIPSTSTPSTNTPIISSAPPSSVPSTHFVPSTLTPSTTISSSLFPSTLTPSTSTPSTNTPSTIIPTSIKCTYNVPNCNFCENGYVIVVDASLFNISCQLLEGRYSYIFASKNSTTINVETSLVVSNSTTFFVGNLSQTTDSNIIFTVNVNENKSGKLNVTGCVSINGTITLVLDAKPQQNSTYQIISYTCQQPVKLNDNQIEIIKNYKNSKCDKYNSNPSSTISTLSVSLSSADGCGKNLGLIIGLSVGIPIALISI